MRVDGLLLVAIAAAAGGLLAVEPLPTACALTACLVIHWRSVRGNAVLVAVFALALGLARAHASLAGFDSEHLALRHALGEPRRCELVARVVSSPVRLGDSMSFSAEVRESECEGVRMQQGSGVRLYGGPSDLRRGDVIRGVAQLAPVQLFHNLELPDPRPGAVRRGVVASGMLLSLQVESRGSGLGALVDQARNHVRARIDATFSGVAAPLGRALVLGENDLSPDDDAAFKKSGLAHLLAVSGTHLVLAVASLVRVLRAFLVRIERLAACYDVERAAAAVGVGLALLYADFAGGSGSAWRAAWMLAAAYLARAFGRHASPIRTLAASALIGALIDPLIAFDISFLLSLCATAGLIVLGRPLGELTARIGSKPLRWLSGSLATTLSAMLPCAPLLTLLSPSLSLVGALANLVAAPVGELLALPLCLVHAVSSPFPPLERGAALAGSGALLFVRSVARASASLHWLAPTLPVPRAWHFVVLAVVLAALAQSTERLRRVGAAALGLLALAGVELLTISAGRPRGELRVSVLDVGQGDSLLVDFPDGRLMLIDGGGFVGSPVDPGLRVILPVLRARRRSRLDVVVLTHPHPDHFTGLASALPELEVGELWDSGQGEAEGAGPVYARLIGELRARGVPIRRPSELCGRAQSFAGARVELLAPCPSFVPHRNANDNSLVLRLALGAQAALLLGDAEKEEEAELVQAHPGALSASLLKAGHHGSRTSSSAVLLDAVTPTFAVLSCGVRNRFGHPHAQTLASLAARHIHTLRTDMLGGLRWSTDGDSVRVESARTAPEHLAH